MLTKDTEEIQHSLADYCKSGELKEIQGAKTDRLHNYRRLIYNIIDDAIESAYPIAKSFINESHWREMIDAFILEHKCQHPQIMRMPGEFIDFVESKEYAEKFNLPFLSDLLQFEWVEVIVHTMKDVAIPAFNLKGDYSASQLVFSPYFELLQLEYPIHQLRKTDLDSAKGNYFMLVYRQENGTVQYLELNQLTYFIVAQMTEENCSLIAAIEPFVKDLDEETKTNFTLNAQQFLINLQELDIVKGISTN